MFGVDGSAAIINHPEVAILGIGRIIDRPWVVDGELAVRKVTELTLAFDHRACDGGTAGGFLRFVADCVESPISLLGRSLTARRSQFQIWTVNTISAIPPAISARPRSCAGVRNQFTIFVMNRAYPTLSMTSLDN